MKNQDTVNGIPVNRVILLESSLPKGDWDQYEGQRRIVKWEIRQSCVKPLSFEIFKKFSYYKLTMKLLCFDMDNTLVRSNTTHLHAFQKTFKKHFNS